ncbi:hypothetical protein Hanom_Chr02g00139611 [Helianthus anomalus]
MLQQYYKQALQGVLTTQPLQFVLSAFIFVSPKYLICFRLTFNFYPKYIY